jgi:hypothetical protein
VVEKDVYVVLAGVWVVERECLKLMSLLSNLEMDYCCLDMGDLVSGLSKDSVL